MSDIIEIEDFLPKLQQNQIKNLLLVDTHILWRQQSFCVLDKLEGKKASTNDPNIKEINQFTHYLFDNREKEPKSDYYDQIAPLLRRNVQKKFNIEIDEELRLRVNFLIDRPHLKNTYSTPHVDHKTPHYTMIYYVNDADGDTYLFKEFADENFKRDHIYIKKTLERRVTPKKGKAVIFNGFRYHAAGNPTITNRVVINYNFTAKINNK